MTQLSKLTCPNVSWFSPGPGNRYGRAYLVTNYTTTTWRHPVPAPPRCTHCTEAMPFKPPSNAHWGRTNMTVSVYMSCVQSVPFGRSRVHKNTGQCGLHAQLKVQVVLYCLIDLQKKFLQWYWLIQLVEKYHYILPYKLSINTR